MQPTTIAEPTAIAACRQGDVVQVVGVIRSVTLLPKGDAPRFEIAVDDASGSVTVTWLGRRRILGIEPGRAVALTGRMTCNGVRRHMFNPRYQLMPARA